MRGKKPSKENKLENMGKEQANVERNPKNRINRRKLRRKEFQYLRISLQLFMMQRE